MSLVDPSCSADIIAPVLAGAGESGHYLMPLQPTEEALIFCKGYRGGAGDTERTGHIANANPVFRPQGAVVINCTQLGSEVTRLMIRPVHVFGFREKQGGAWKGSW